MVPMNTEKYPHHLKSILKQCPTWWKKASNLQNYVKCNWITKLNCHFAIGSFFVRIFIEWCLILMHTVENCRKYVKHSSYNFCKFFLYFSLYFSSIHSNKKKTHFSLHSQGIWRFLERIPWCMWEHNIPNVGMWSRSFVTWQYIGFCCCWRSWNWRKMISSAPNTTIFIIVTISMFNNIQNKMLHLWLTNCEQCKIQMLTLFINGTIRFNWLSIGWWLMNHFNYFN